MGVPLQWVSKLQNQIILGTMEAEYIALSQSMRDLISLRELLKEINRIFLTDSNTTSFHSYSNTFTLPQSIVYEDNQSCLKCATMPKTSPRTKYIAVSYHFFWTKVRELEIQVIAIGTDDQLADQFTKRLHVDNFFGFRKNLMG